MAEYPREPLLKSFVLLELRPTQMSVGFREVQDKRDRWREQQEKGAEFLGDHMLPVVIGPKHRRYIIDHHHLALALHREGVEHVATTVVSDLGHLDKENFWTVMAHKNWAHPYDREGRLRAHKDIPKTVEGLEDDPFRSLAGELRRKGAFAKDTAPFSEFLWADFFRRRIKREDIDRDFGKAAGKAFRLARSGEAQYLPGWCGPTKGT